MNLFEQFRRPRKSLDFRKRRVPSEPEGTDPTTVYLGSDLGRVPYSGEKPLPGDMAITAGQPGERFALSPQTPGLGAPLFSQTCTCKCNGSTAGTIFWANPIHLGPYLVVMDGSGNFLQTLNPPQLFRIAGVAADGDPPFNLYVLDDRTRLDNFVTDASPDTQIRGISTYALHTFTNSGSGYTWASVFEFPDPGIPDEPAFFEEMEWVTEGAAHQVLADPPATYPTNCMAVINGLLYVTMSMAPARYLVWNGSGLVTHTLALSGASFAKGLRGQIVTGIAKPGKVGRFFVIAWAPAGFGEPGAGGFELVEFDATDTITRHFNDDGRLVSPTQLVIQCNRVMALSSDSYGRTEDGGAGGVAGTTMAGTGGPPLTVLDGLLIDDFCKTGDLKRITKQQAFNGALNGVKGAAAASLGCAPVISHWQSPVNGAVLSRIDRTGNYSQALLKTGGAGDRSQPGPSSHVYAVPGANLIDATTTNPFPLASGLFQATHVLGSDNWFFELDGGFLFANDHHEYHGFGAAHSPYWTLKVPPGRAFNGRVLTGRLENHVYDNYQLAPVVSFAQEPLSLGFSSVNNDYEWSIRQASGSEVALVTCTRLADSTFWQAALIWTEVHPALLASSGPTLSGELANDGSANGTGLHRSYCYFPFASGVVMPDFGGVESATYTIGQGELRPVLVVYSLDDGGATQPTGLSMTIEGISQTPSVVSLPTPQLNPRAGGPTDFDFNNAMSFGISTLTVKTEPGTGRQFVGLDVTISMAGGYSGTATIEYPENPNLPPIPLSQFLAVPRYYEILAQFTFGTVF